jgi:hypothetical protein
LACSSPGNGLCGQSENLFIRYDHMAKTVVDFLSQLTGGTQFYVEKQFTIYKIMEEGGDLPRFLKLGKTRMAV